MEDLIESLLHFLVWDRLDLSMQKNLNEVVKNIIDVLSNITKKDTEWNIISSTLTCNS